MTDERPQHLTPTKGLCAIISLTARGTSTQLRGNGENGHVSMGDQGTTSRRAKTPKKEIDESGS